MLYTLRKTMSKTEHGLSLISFLFSQIKTAYQDTTSEMLFLSLIYFYTVWLFFLFVTVSR